MELIKDNLVVFSKDKCRYCTQAKKLLSEYSVPFKEIKLNPDNSDKYINLREKLIKLTNGHKTFPFVFFGHEFIGGFDQLQHSMATNMPEKLKSAGIIVNNDDF